MFYWFKIVLISTFDEDFGALYFHIPLAHNTSIITGKLPDLQDGCEQYHLVFMEDQQKVYDPLSIRSIASDYSLKWLGWWHDQMEVSQMVIWMSMFCT